MKWLWIAVFPLVLLWSGIAPKDRITWILEVAPALIGAMTALILPGRLHDRQLARLNRPVEGTKRFSP